MNEQERLRCNAIDIGGLNSADRDRIEKVGFERWRLAGWSPPPMTVN